MANTLTNMVNDIYTALDVVSREQTGMLASVTMDATSERAALNQTIRVPIAPASTAANITPAVTPPATGSQIIGNANFTISKSRAVPFLWNGEETRSVNNASGPTRLTIQQGQIAQAMRTLTNEVETDLCALQSTFSRAAGADGTNPFATAGDFTDAAEVAQILKDNGAPGVGNRLVINTTAGVNLIGLQSRADIQADTSMLRQGVLLDAAGFAITESAQVVTSSAGAMASATTDATGYAVGATALTLATAGTGVVAAGDILTFAGDANQYVVASVVFAGANPASGDVITLAAPGLRIAMSAATKAITVVGDTARNMGFAPSAIILAARLPIVPEGGDMASDRMTITDPHSGLSFDFAAYPGYHQVHYEIGLAWGQKNIKPEHTALLIG